MGAVDEMLVMPGNGGEGGLRGANTPGQGQIAHRRVQARLRGSGSHDSPVFQQGPGPGWQQPDLWNN